MSVMILKLADKVLKMQAEIDAKKAVVNSAKQLEKDIMIQRQIKVISGLSQEMLYLNQSERLIDPAVLEMAKFTSGKDNAYRGKSKFDISLSNMELPLIDVNQPEALSKSSAPAIDYVPTGTVADTQMKKDTNSSPNLTSDSKMVAEIESIIHHGENDTTDKLGEPETISENVLSTESGPKSQSIITTSDKLSDLERISENILSSASGPKSQIYSKIHQIEEDTTSDDISEKLSELEIISENILSSQEKSDKAYQYEDDFESDEASSSILPEIPGDNSKSAFPAKG